ncbi:MAG TPA: hypothetical protein VEQ60_24435 [Longimicrobium sp.]|nr:hypothetical protein [Longimicrobium sp.]
MVIIEEHTEIYLAASLNRRKLQTHIDVYAVTAERLVWHVKSVLNATRRSHEAHKPCTTLWCGIYDDPVDDKGLGASTTTTATTTSIWAPDESYRKQADCDSSRAHDFPRV